MKKVFCLALVMCMLMTIGTSNVFAETLYDSDIRLVSRTENDDGTIIVVINENGKDLKMTFTPVEVNSISPYSSSDMPGGYRLPSDYYNWNWNGWGTPGLSRYNAEAEQSLQAMNQLALSYFLSSGLGVNSSDAYDVAGYLKDCFVPGQTTIWLDRITWLNNNYTAYRRKDYYYSDSSYTSLIYQHAIREYVGGNR